MKRALYLFALIPLLLGNAALAHEGINVTEVAKSTRSWDNSVLPEYPEGQPEVTILRVVVPPQTSLPLHKHTVINAGVLLRGELTVVAKSGETLQLKAGDPIVEVVDKWHRGRNDGDEPAEIIVFYAGVKDQPVTVKTEQTAPPQGD